MAKKFPGKKAKVGRPGKNWAPRGLRLDPAAVAAAELRRDKEFEKAKSVGAHTLTGLVNRLLYNYGFGKGDL